MTDGRFTVRVPRPDLALLDALVERHAADERELMHQWRARHRHLPAGELASAHRRLRVEVAAERAAGRLLGTRSLLVAHGLHTELRERGWDRDWPDPGEARWRRVAPGRPGDGAGTADPTVPAPVELPGDLAQRLTRACHWHLQDHRRQHRATLDRRHGGREAWSRKADRGDADVLAHLEAFRAGIVTEAQVLRAAVERILTPARR
ncbi:hypothetical protein [Kitasatospora sp. DSM 101779]|uniref:hypothetical protein n=1 Tax=Kitasatospora sp. DSM 101779 TaxID=2853165 RepID=UPI0021D9CDDE|nr:hypothetical protein [Kitasatospora sp. DSM 101779]MCU7821020.1 hypothetical protein [Kitasatospora sp. DSM 101779]